MGCKVNGTRADSLVVKRMGFQTLGAARRVRAGRIAGYAPIGSARLDRTVLAHPGCLTTAPGELPGHFAGATTRSRSLASEHDHDTSFHQAAPTPATPLQGRRSTSSSLALARPDSRSPGT